MKQSDRTRLEVVAFICAVVLVFVSAAPIFNRGSDANLLGLIAGSFGAGVMLANLIRNRRDSDRRG
jgi:hypothetical protein